MVKILSRSGTSLADIYDVKGSIAGIDQLETRELSIVHEMGATVFSERLHTTIRRATDDALAQNTAFEAIITNLPSVPTRLLGMAVVTDDASRISRAAVMLRDPESSGGTEIPIWAWDQSTSVRVNFIDLGSSVTFDLLVSAPPVFVPTFIGGSGQQPDPVDEIVLRGVTTGFGAGTVFMRVFYYMAFPFLGGLSSRGLPVPSW